MKLIAWFLLIIICLILSMSIIGIIIAVPMFFIGTLAIILKP